MRTEPPQPAEQVDERSISSSGGLHGSAGVCRCRIGNGLRGVRGTAPLTSAAPLAGVVQQTAQGIVVHLPNGGTSRSMCAPTDRAGLLRRHRHAGRRGIPGP